MGKSIEEPISGCVYKHFKGKFYYYIGSAIQENTQEHMAIYKRVGDPQVFVRPLKQFLQKNTEGVTRFTLVEKLRV